MRKIADAFKDRKAFIPFITAGDPDLATTEALIKIAADAGAALIEIGIPFSDPIAEGPVIQEADIRALAAGTTVDGIFVMAARLRETIDIPMVLMGYANPFFHYGYDAFFKRCAEVGIDGAIIPDIPFEEKHEAADAAGQYGVAVLSMIAPTSEERIQKIAAEAQGFIYLVSSMGVTGMRSAITTDLGAMVSAIRQVTDVPIGIGFGIHTPQQAAEMAAIADGAIVGSAIVNLVAEHGRNAGPAVEDYVKQMVAAVCQVPVR
ncbi:tryptophan synthase, alpha subunit [Pseudoramibacter alactolyticus ATCC 23263]|uniref:Tryptophan synthase alpha chain n=1 Tax=Pseudoramibacter alactolyticus ATCC 23263 TaxID=887929 RepID=E6MDX4_9FIRM|nr:tryptophan synthase subunit alpha [Pseudoramibacter alactolyticus]EFV02733.1 tryptophan synthase, alpha subunit [Pseudoramibacter alactolyticus ATCC 23263]